MGFRKVLYYVKQQAAASWSLGFRYAAPVLHLQHACCKSWSLGFQMNGCGWEILQHRCCIKIRGSNFLQHTYCIRTSETPTWRWFIWLMAPPWLQHLKVFFLALNFRYKTEIWSAVYGLEWSVFPFSSTLGGIWGNLIMWLPKYQADRLSGRTLRVRDRGGSFYNGLYEEKFQKILSWIFAEQEILRIYFF